jgi:O-antigen/teichoic acid export membrane protein
MPQLLQFWVGEYVSEDSIKVGQILCAGVFLNSVGAMYFSFLHALGKTKETALLHIFEVPIFIALLYVAIINFGVIGAAIAWVARVFFDSVVLMIMYLRLQHGNSNAL